MDTRFVNVVVKGDSMWPTLSAGSTVRFERVEAEALEAGQVVLLDHPFRPDPVSYTHLTLPTKA